MSVRIEQGKFTPKRLNGTDAWKVLDQVLFWHFPSVVDADMDMELGSVEGSCLLFSQPAEHAERVPAPKRGSPLKIQRFPRAVNLSSGNLACWGLSPAVQQRVETFCPWWLGCVNWCCVVDGP